MVKAHFEAAHCIPGHKGKCARLHGHSYLVEAEFTGEQLDTLGMLYDFGDLKSVLNEFLPDHTYLNEIMPFSTTAENVARWIYDQLLARGLPVNAVTLWETQKYGCRYTSASLDHS